MNPAPPVMRIVNPGSPTRRSSIRDSGPVTGGDTARTGLARPLRSSVRSCVAPCQSATSPRGFPESGERVLCSYRLLEPVGVGKRQSVIEGYDESIRSRNHEARAWVQVNHRAASTVQPGKRGTLVRHYWRERFGPYCRYVRIGRGRPESTHRVAPAPNALS